MKVNGRIPEIKDAAARNSEEEEAAAKPMFSHHDHEEVPAQLLTSNNAENQFQVSLLQTSVAALSFYYGLMAKPQVPRQIIFCNFKDRRASFDIIILIQVKEILQKNCII